MEIGQSIEVVFFFFTIAVAIGYVLMLAKILNGWDKTPEWETPKKFNPNTKVSIIIAARNEEHNIASCIDSIISNEYPIANYEVIIVDDSSTDNTIDVVNRIKSDNLTVISNTNSSGKKGALHTGIQHASGDLIITTDADSIVGVKWISSIVSLYELSNADIITGPIQYIHDKSAIQRFQYIDGTNNMAVTAHGITNNKYFLANGANLAYRKNLYHEIGGFNPEHNLASGDDTFMIQKAARLGKKIKFIKSKEAIVITKPESKLNDLIKQRKRWATKTKSYEDSRVIKIQGYVFFFVALLVLNLSMSFFGSGLSFFGFLFGLSIKLAIDFMYLKKLNTYFESEDALRSFISNSFMYLVYILVSGGWALFPSKYEWKERKVN